MKAEIQNFLYIFYTLDCMHNYHLNNLYLITFACKIIPVTYGATNPKQFEMELETPIIDPA